MSETPRFIAGAVCPACGQMDKIKMWEEDGVPHRSCVACGYADTLNAQGQAVPAELQTRVNRATDKPRDTVTHTIQFVANPKLKKKD